MFLFKAFFIALKQFHSFHATSIQKLNFYAFCNDAILWGKKKKKGNFCQHSSKLPSPYLPNLVKTANFKYSNNQTNI